MTHGVYENFISGTGNILAMILRDKKFLFDRFFSEVTRWNAHNFGGPELTETARQKRRALWLEVHALYKHFSFLFDT